MTLTEIWNEWGEKHRVWGKLDGTWKRIIENDGETVTILDWELPSEIGSTRVAPISDFTEFDVTN